jgi:hypothetical protein
MTEKSSKQANPVSIRLTEDEEKYLKEIGGKDSVVAGVRTAIAFYKENYKVDNEFLDIENELEELRQYIDTQSSGPYALKPQEIKELKQKYSELVELHLKAKTKAIDSKASNILKLLKKA